MSNEEQKQEQKPPEAQLSSNTLLTMLVTYFAVRRADELRTEEHKND